MSAQDGTERTARGLRIPTRRLQRGLLWLLAFSGAFVIIEPSPYEVMFLVALVGFAATGGIRFPRAVVPLALLLLTFNLGGVFAVTPYLDDRIGVTFVAISLYMMVTAVFFAVIMSEDAEARLAVIRSGFIASAWIAAIAGILGYFDIAGLGEAFTRYTRASGTFKDPNVFGPYLSLAIVLMVQDIVLGRGRLVVSLMKISVPAVALLLSLSRGAWLNAIGSTLLLLALTFLTSRSDRLRARLVWQGACLVILGVAIVLVALSIDSIGEILQQRTTLLQDYDAGPTGRFANQLRSVPMLLERPNGFGPLRFGRFYFGEDPHNVYLNAFASYGWLGGISYFVLIVVTWVVAWRSLFVRGPLQRHLIALWSVLCFTTLQGVQIDSDHWRHFYLLIGLVWGITAVSHRLAAPPGPTRTLAN